jgi:hypothetical protein
VKSQDSSRIDCQKFSTRLDGWWNLDRVMPGTVVPPASERTSDTAGVLQESMLEAVAGWHPAVQALVRGLDPTRSLRSRSGSPSSSTYTAVARLS